MALEFAHGAIQWLSTDAATTVYTVSGLSFQPKALRFYSVGIQSATDATSTTTSSERSVGFATSASSRRACTGESSVGAGSADCGSIATSTAVIVHLSSSTILGLLDINTITSDGFTLIVDDATPVSATVFWEAWGGSDITVAVVGDIAEPAATGNVDYTVTGFVAGATDQVVMFAGVQSTAALGTGQNTDSGFHVGFATSGAAADNVTVCGNSDDGSATMETDGYCQDGECLSMIVIGGGTSVNARAQLTQFGTDNYRLNWIARGTTNRRSIFLGIKGGNWKAGSYVIDTTVTTNTATVSGLSFAPIGMSLVGRGTAEQTTGTAGSTDRISLGSGTSTSSRRCMGVIDADTVGTSAIAMFVEYDQVLASLNTTAVIFAAIDIDAMLSDGFRNIVDVAGGSATEWQGFLAFGSVAAAAQNSFFEVRVPAYA